MKKAKPKNKKTVGKLRLDLWDEFSLYIKILHSVDGEWCRGALPEPPVEPGGYWTFPVQLRRLIANCRR